MLPSLNTVAEEETLDKGEGAAKVDTGMASIRKENSSVNNLFIPFFLPFCKIRNFAYIKVYPDHIRFLHKTSLSHYIAKNKKRNHLTG